MKRNLILLCSLPAILFGGACRQAERRTEGIIDEPPAVAPSGTVTLSSEQLLTLDQGWRSPSRPRVVGRRAAGDSGVIFDIRFPSNEPGHRSIDYVSSGSGGQMALVGLSIGAYETFALKFTLVAVDGAVGANLSQELVVGAVIGPTTDGKVSGYEPLALTLAPQRMTGFARTRIGTEKIREIGIHAHMDNPEAWSPEGSTVTLRVEPVANATPLPWSSDVAKQKRRP